MKKEITIILFMLFTGGLYCQVTFTALATGATQQLLGISFANGNTGYACGTGGTVLKTSNAGLSWTALTTNTTEDLSDIRVIPGSNGQKVIAGGDNNTIIKSMDGGLSWSSQSIPFQSGSFVFGIQCLDSLNYFACGGDYGTFSGSILKTTNGGATWTKTPIAGSIFLDKIFMLNATKGFAAGTNASFSDGSVQRTNNGSSWSSAKTSANLLTNVWCNSHANIVSVGLAGQIWKSTDGGTNWTDQSFNSVDLFGLQFTDSLKGFACGGSASGNIILSTTDGGLSWSQLPYAFSGAFNALSVINNTIYIAGDQGKIVKGTWPLVDVGLTDTPEEATVAFYPNPASGKIQINLSTRIVSEAKLVIRDASGITQKEISFIGSVVEVDLSGFKSGIYFCEINHGNQVIKRGKLIIQ